MALRLHGEVPADRAVAIAAFVADHAITEQVFRAADAAGLRLAGVVDMDEYTIDLVFAWPGGVWLVYDTT